MDERLAKALDFSNYRISLFNRKEDIKTRFNTMLLHSCNGGNFKINPELICFAKLLIDSGRNDAVLIDINGNPVELNIQSFYTDILSKYVEATNYYNFEYSKLRKSRTVSSIYDIIEG